MNNRYSQCAAVEEAREKYDEARHAVRTLLSYIGEDPDRPGLVGTPRRVVDALMEMTWPGETTGPKELLSVVFDEPGADAMVTVGPIPFTSLCEHHLLPFAGRAWIGYVPEAGRVVGLSKLPRVLDYYAARLQLQERIGTQVADAIEAHLSPNVGVVLDATHGCMAHRGVKKPGAIMRSTVLRGVFRSDPQARAEFLALPGPQGA